MGDSKFTEDQEKVVYSHICNLLVSAAAGSGKTTVLVSRIIDHIKSKENPVDIDRILIVTFTKNAAAHMKEKIYRAIEKECLDNPEDKRMAIQLGKVAYADIMTIDSFCLKVVKNYFYVLDIDPNFRIMDSDETKIMINQVIDEVLEEAYELNDSEFINLVETYCDEKNDKVIKDAISDILNVQASQPFPDEYLDCLDKIYEPAEADNVDDLVFVKEVYEYGIRIVKNAIEHNIKAQSLLEFEEGLDKYSTVLNTDLDQLNSIIATNNFSEFANKIQSVSWDKMSPPGKTVVYNKNIANRVKNIRDSYKNLVNELKNGFFSYDCGLISSDNSRVYNNIKVLAELVKKVNKKLEVIKKNKGCYTFSDVAHMALNIICEKNDNGEIIVSEYAEELRKAYDEIMIDEYQDSNRIQEVLLSSISGEKYGNPNMFMVGDVKQSIYKFRMAEPKLFMHKYDTFKEDDDVNKLITLKENFRSSQAVVNTVNDIFESAMTKDFCGIAYDDKAKLKQGLKYNDYDGTKESKSELNYIVCPDGMPKEDRNSRQVEAIIRKIKKLMNGEESIKVLEDKEYRPLRYSDIAILVRSMSGIADELAAKLPEAGIPVSVNTNSGYFKSREISLILSYLRILDNPYQDVDFVAVLMSYIGGLTVEDMAKIKISDKQINSGDKDKKKKYFYSLVLDYMNRETADEKVLNKLNKFMKVYDKLRNLKKFVSLYELVLKIFEDTGFYDYVYILPVGEGRRANLDMLLVKIRAFQDTDGTGINGFMAYIDRLIKYEIDTGEANASDTLDTVKIMTIHKSKGLEYPVVFLAAMEHGFNFNDKKGKFTLLGEKGIGARIINEKNNSYHDSLQKEYIDNCIKQEIIAEEIRILYVALTRARQKLIMMANCEEGYDKKKKANKISGMDSWINESQISQDGNSFAYLIKSDCYLDFVAPALFRSIGFSGDYTRNYENDDLRVVFEKADKLTEAMIETEDTAVEEEMATITKRVKEVKEYFSYKYSYDNDKVPVKYSVSELKHEAMDKIKSEISDEAGDEIYPDIPSGYPEEEADSDEVLIVDISDTTTSLRSKIKLEDEVNIGALRGTATHLFMEKVIVTEYTEVNELETFMKELVTQGIFTQVTSEYVNLNKVSNFLNSDIAMRMRQAYKRGELFLEQPFVYGIKANELKPEVYKSDERVLIQGIIDAFFFENDEIVLIDYKTDKVETGECLEALYSKQMELYGMALCDVSKKSIKDIILYSFSLEKGVSCNKVVDMLRKV